MPSLLTELRSVVVTGLVIITLTAQAADTVRIVVQSSPLAGFQYYSGQVHWEEMKVGDPLVLVREPDNPHDAKAIRVEWRGEKLGYLPRAENRAVAAEMDNGGRVEGRIAELRQSRNPWQRVRIEVSVAF